MIQYIFQASSINRNAENWEENCNKKKRSEESCTIVQQKHRKSRTSYTCVYFFYTQHAEMQFEAASLFISMLLLSLFRLWSNANIGCANCAWLRGNWCTLVHRFKCTLGLCMRVNAHKYSGIWIGGHFSCIPSVTAICMSHCIVKLRFNEKHRIACWRVRFGHLVWAPLFLGVRIVKKN